MKRLIDIIGSLVGIVVLSPVMVVIAIVVKANSPGPAWHVSDRMGRNGKLFRMAKFRSMYVGTPDVASDKLENAQSQITKVGAFLRKTSLDELPQLFNVLRGDMSLVGPRPALYNQYDLIAMREEAGVDRLRPGVTGWAQVNGRDEIPLERKVALDREYLQKQSFWLDIRIIIATLVKAVRSDGITH